MSIVSTVNIVINGYHIITLVEIVEQRMGYNIDADNVNRNTILIGELIRIEKVITIT